MTLIFALAITLLLVTAIIYDVTRFIIPNWLNGILVLLYPAWVLLSPHPIDWVSGLSCGLVLLFGGFGLYAAKLLGAGDVKLLAACGLYTGLSMAGVSLIFYMALLGGLMAVTLLFTRPVLRSMFKGKTLPKILTVKAPVPYGLAIAGSCLIMIWTGRMPGMLISELNIL